MSTREFAIEGLKKLHELREEERAIHETIKAKEEEEHQKIVEIYSGYHHAGAEIYKFIKEHDIFVASETEVDVGSYHEQWVKGEKLTLYGQQVALTYNGVHHFTQLPSFAVSKEALKERLLSNKRQKKQKIETELRAEIYTLDKKIKSLEEKEAELDKKIEKLSKRKPAFLFKNKLENLKTEKEASAKEKDELVKTRAEIQEQLQAYVDLHLFVTDEEVAKDFELFTKVDKLISDFHAQEKERDQQAKQVRYNPKEERAQIESNRAAQTKVLEALLSPELLGEVEAYAASREADPELVEVATKVLKAGGRGPKKVTL